MLSQHSLLPHKYKKVGWILLLPSVIAGLILLIQNPSNSLLQFPVKLPSLFVGNDFLSNGSTNILPTIIGILIIVGALLVLFSKEKIEDEFIAKLRLKSLLWAVLVNYLILIIAFIFIYSLDFINVMLYNMFTVLFIFIIRFNYLLYRNTKSANNAQ